MHKRCMCLRTCGDQSKTSAGMTPSSARVANMAVRASHAPAEVASVRATPRTLRVFASPICRTRMSKSSNMTKLRERVYRRRLRMTRPYQSMNLRTGGMSSGVSRDSLMLLSPVFFVTDALCCIETRTSGSKEVWAALKNACEADHETA